MKSKTTVVLSLG